MNDTKAVVPPPPGEPRPEPIRFFGTTWVQHDRGYGWRRAAATTGSLLATAAGVLALGFGIHGLTGFGFLLTALTVAGFAAGSVLAFRRTWQGYTGHPPADSDPVKPTSSLYALGFVGTLLAYFLRSLTEAPGERHHRTAYETARAEHLRRRAARSGNPANHA
ncbi:EamA/RhaT family transporter [Streptomyces sp. ITFR-21]|nr:EamA/RhaT family transporter [Streptomyces sp. ITFR-21]WNI17118.1 EamA/RhaT family transporter [Streptomyces sp. ITFR-21]